MALKRFEGSKEKFHLNRRACDALKGARKFLSLWRFSNSTEGCSAIYSMAAIFPQQAEKMRKLLLSATAVTLPILAGVSTPAKAVPPVPYSWTGFYIGANAGFGIGETDFSNNTLLMPPGETVRVGMGSGFVGGGQVGYNFQVAPYWVLGAEGNFAWANIRGLNEDPFFSGKNFSSRTNWLASATGRVGYTNGGGMMLYAKGGPAWLNSQYGITTDLFNNTVSETRLGYTVGGGVEWSIAPALTAKVEFDYYGVSSHNIDPVTLTGSTTVTVQHNIETFIFGINYHFGGM